MGQFATRPLRGTGKNNLLFPLSYENASRKKEAPRSIFYVRRCQSSVSKGGAIERRWIGEQERRNARETTIFVMNESHWQIEKLIRIRQKYE